MHAMKMRWMPTTLRVVHAALLLALATPAFAAKARPTDLLGLVPGMSDREVQHRLEKIGVAVRGQDRAKQTWQLRDSRYEYVIIRFDEEWKLHWATAFAREGGRRVRYADLGDLTNATHAGQHFYTWSIPAKQASRGWSLVARGGDAKYLDSVSIEAGPMRQALIVPLKTEDATEED